jgi:undecaprenyl-diphosphatase
MAPRLPLRHAVALGLVQGPAELLPVSSSAHIALIPLLLGWPQAELDGELRNHFEVALHGGAAVALSIARRRELAGAVRKLDGPGLATVALALAPPALVGYLLERRLERRPSTPAALAAGLALGGLAMALADSRAAGRRPAPCSPAARRTAARPPLTARPPAADCPPAAARPLADAGPCDGLALGVAQSLALLPGVSRNGATLTVARLRGFAREDAQALSWRTGLPVILGATLLKGRAAVAGDVPADVRPALVAGAVAAFLSTLACSPLVAPGRRGRALAPFSLYRVALALLALRGRRRS